MSFNLRKPWAKLTLLFKQGFSPKQLAKSIALAFLIGIFPIYGTTSLILTFLAIRLKLNLPLILSVNYLLTPVQLLMIIPFVRAGEFIFGFESVDLSLEGLQAAFQAGYFEAIILFADRLAIAIGAWALIGIPLFLLVYLLVYYAVKMYKANKISRTTF